MKSLHLVLFSSALISLTLLPGCKYLERYSPLFDSPQNGAHVTQNKIDVFGHLVFQLNKEEQQKQNDAKQEGDQATFNPTGDVYVNGIKAVRNGQSWYIKNFSLVAGKNILHAHYSKSDAGLDHEITIYADLGNQAPTASFTTTPSSGYAPLAVQLNASASTDADGTITEYAWDFGDGQTGTGKQISHVFQAIGSYTVQLTVKDNDGLTQSATRIVSVTTRQNQNPTAVMQASPTSGMAPLTVNFGSQGSTDSDGQVTGYHWDFGDGQTATGATVSHTYTQAGNITATLSVTDNDGGMASASRIIQVTADTTAPILSVDLEDNATLNTATPIFTFTYSDTESSIDPQTLAVFVDGSDVGEQLAIGDESALLQFTESFPLSNGSHMLSARISDHAGNISQISKNFRIDLGIIHVGYIVGKVLDVQGNPIEGVTISTTQAPVGESLIGVTRADGTFELAFTTPGHYTLKADKGGWTSGLQNADTIEGRDTAVETIHLMAADTKVTTVTPTGGTASNSSGSISLAVPAGALSENTELSFTEATSGSGLQITLPNLSQFTYAMDNQPSGTTFATPATMTIANTLGFSAGTRIPYGIIDENLGVWTDSGHVGLVSADGQTVQFAADHFSQYDINYPLYLSENQSNPNATATNSNAQRGNGAEPCATCGSRISNSSGSLGIDYALPAVTRVGQSYGLSFSYQSLSAKPSVILGAVNGNSGGTAPDGVKARFQFSNKLVENHYAAESNVKPSLVRTLVDAKNTDGTYLSTGSYPYQVELGALYSNVDYATADYFGGPATGDTGVRTRDPVALEDAVDDRVVVQNEIHSPFGAGWSLNGLEKLSADPEGTVTWTDGSGTVKVFTRLDFANESSKAILQNQNISQMIYHRGFIYATSCEANQVYRIGQNGVVQTLAGTGEAGFNKDGIRAKQAQLNCPIAITPSRRGGIYVADRDNHRIRYIDSHGVIHTVAGSTKGKHAADIGAPIYLKEDSVLALHFISDHQIYTVSPHDHKILKMAGTGSAYIKTDLDSPSALDVDRYGNFIVLDSGNSRILKLFPNNGQTRVLLDHKSGLDHPVDFAFDPVLKRYFIIEKSGRVQVWNGSGHTRLVPLASTATGFEMAKFHDATKEAGPRPTAIAFSPEIGLISASREGMKLKLLNQKSASSVNTGPISYTSPEGEFSHLTRASDGSYYRLFVNGDSIRYLSNGLISSREFPDGKSIQYQYDSKNRISQIVLPDQSSYLFSYDARGYLRSVKDPANRISSFTVNALGQLAQITNPIGNNHSFTYRNDHLMTSQTDEDGLMTEYQYTDGRLTGEIYPGNRNRGVSSAALSGLSSAIDPQALVSSFTSPEGRNESVSLDSFGLEFARTNAAGDVAYRVRDAEGQPTQQTSYEGRASSSTYDEYGNPVQTSGPNGSTLYRYDSVYHKVNRVIDGFSSASLFQMTYNEQGLVADLADVFSSHTLFTYHPLGQMKTSTDALGNQTTYEIDTQGNTSAVIDPLLQRTEFARNAAGDVTAVKDADGRITQTHYDSIGRPMQTLDGLGNTADFNYTPSGQLSAVTNSKGHSMQFSYNEQHLVSATQNALGQNATYTYDRDGNLLQKTTLAGQAIQYQINELNQVTKKTAPDQTVQYQYDRDGLVTQVANSSATLARVYDEQGRIRRETQSTLANSQLDYGYSPQGWKTRMTFSRGGSVVADMAYSYNLRGDVTSITSMVGSRKLVYRRTYDDLFRLYSETFPNGMTTVYDYDAASRLVHVQNNTAASTSISGLGYHYSPAGDVLSINNDSAVTPEKKEYTYDAAHRLTGVSGTETDSFVYDAVGNRTNHGESYNEINQLLSDSNNDYRYDLNGNLTSIKKKDNSKETVLAWSSENLLIGLTYKEAGNVVKTITYQYDGLNRRIEKNLVDLVNPSKSHTRRYVYDGSHILLETDQNNKIVAFYLHGPETDHPIAMLRDRDGNSTFSINEVYSYTRDHLGSIRELVDYQQKVVQRYRYSAYGKTTVEKSDSSADHELVENLFAYTGREYDQDTELYGYRNRYYYPELGRFISQDPIGLNGGDLNLYRYAKNNPLIYKDSNGAFLNLAVGALLGAATGAFVAYLNDKDPIQGALTGGAVGLAIASGAALGAYVAESLGAAATTGAFWGGGVGGYVGSVGTQKITNPDAPVNQTQAFLTGVLGAAGSAAAAELGPLFGGELAGELGSGFISSSTYLPIEIGVGGSPSKTCGGR